MSLLLIAALLPGLFWDRGAETVLDGASPIKLKAPSVDFRMEEASATREPWINSNAWRILREPDGHFVYEAPGNSAALAAAEAFMYGADASVHTDNAGLKPLAEMQQFLTKFPADRLAPMVNIGFQDDGSEASGEFMNLLVRRNLLFKIVDRPDPHLDLTVKLGTPAYPKSEAGNPSLLAEKVRAHLTDSKRLLRIYGSYLVIGRLVGSGSHARLYLINYGAAKSEVDGIRIRVMGEYPQQALADYQAPGAKLMDVTAAAGGTEFTIPKLPCFAVVELKR